MKMADTDTATEQVGDAQASVNKRLRVSLLFFAVLLALGVLAVTVGPWSSSSSLSLAAVKPSAPGKPVLTDNHGTFGVSWSAPTSDGGDTVTYTVMELTNKGAWTQVATRLAATSFVYRETLAKNTYCFAVFAVNSAGQGPWSSPSYLQATAVKPSVPGKPALSANNGTLGVSWSAPTSNGGATVTYTVMELTNKGAWTKVSTGLTSRRYNFVGTSPNNTYCFAIIAVNSAGSSRWSRSAFLKA